MNKILLILLCYSVNCYSNIFDSWTEFNKQNREAVYNLFTGNVKNASKPKDTDFESTTIKFKDIIGGVPEEITDLKAFLQDDEAFKDAGAKKPKGILLVGPPGCGKTLIAKSIAGELDAVLIDTSASKFMELYVGSGPLKIREIFKQAENATLKGKKAIIFIDELDALGKRTSGAFEHAERNNTITELLVQMDGFEKNDNITIIAATNRVDSLDEALLRAGRFDNIITIPLPDMQKREAMLQHYLFKNNRKVDPKINVKYYAQNSEGFNCADINDLVNKAATRAGRNKRKEILQEDIESSFAELKKLRRNYK
ncbi:MAG: AAA family ATPase [Candidatus Babeliales bacterium]|nr:AAA family ATPase [Candidatus Babeliales bacterium]